MKAIKTRELSRKAIQHLISIGYRLDEPLDHVLDSPYIYADKLGIQPISSNILFRDSNGILKTEAQVLKMRPEVIKDKENPIMILGEELVRFLNKNSKVSGYDVSFSLGHHKYDKGRISVFPITNTACGGISVETMRLILDFANEHPLRRFYFSYTDVNDEYKTYGTLTPCIDIS